jgi:hypothetical protein
MRGHLKDRVPPDGREKVIDVQDPATVFRSGERVGTHDVDGEVVQRGCIG